MREASMALPDVGAPENAKQNLSHRLHGWAREHGVNSNQGFQWRYSSCHSAKAEYSSPPNREARVPSLAISLNPRSRSKPRKAEKPSGYGTHGLGGLPSYSTTSNRSDRVRSHAMKAPWCLM